MEDGMEQFHTWYREAMESDLQACPERPSAGMQRLLNSSTLNVEP
jgi:hypothetical protein